MTSLSHLARPLDIGGVETRNRVFLAPMSGITDEPFRRRAHEHGAGLVVSEMVASGELAKGRSGHNLRIRHSGLPVHMVQLAGREAAHMAEGARIAVGEGADIVDINMGCPARKVTGGYAGSALMRDLDHALTLIEAVVGAVDVPVTLKMRLGWDGETLNAPLLASRAEQAGIRMVTVALAAPVASSIRAGRIGRRSPASSRRCRSRFVCHGDVSTPQEAVTILEQSGADAVMIGRAHYGAPWLAGSIATAASGGNSVEPRSIADYVAAHHEDMLSLYGVESGLRQARKHLGWYLDRHAPETSDERRKTILTSFDPAEVRAHLRVAFDAQAQGLRSAA